MSIPPYDEGGLPSYEHIHANVPATTVPTEWLSPTQPALILDRLLAIHHGHPAEGPDPYPHVIAHDDALWIRNGHHRWVCALLRGDPTITVRIFEAAT